MKRFAALAATALVCLGIGAHAVEPTPVGTGTAAGITVDTGSMDGAPSGTGGLPAGKTDMQTLSESQWNRDLEDFSSDCAVGETAISNGDGTSSCGSPGGAATFINGSTADFREGSGEVYYVDLDEDGTADANEARANWWIDAATLFSSSWTWTNAQIGDLFASFLGGRMEACKTGFVKGGGYASASGLWAWTCGNYNWHGDASATEDGAQATASYDVTCTGRGTPNRACPYDGAVIHVGYPIHRAAIAMTKTQRNGEVLLPLDSGRDYALYVDQGAGCLSTGTINPSMGAIGSDCTGGTSFNARYPTPIAWWLEELFPTGYAETGAPSQLRAMQVLHGISIVGEQTCKVEYVDSADCPVAAGSADSRALCVEPRYTGVCILNDRGAADINGTSGSPPVPAIVNLATPYVDGPSAGFVQPTFTNMGGSPGTPNCVPTSDADFTCQNASYGIKGGYTSYDFQSSFIAPTGAITQINPDNPYEVCINNDFVDPAASPGLGSACAKAPWIQCDSGTNNLYSAGGCWEDTNGNASLDAAPTDTDLGPCRGNVDLAEHLLEERDMDLIAHILLPNCREPITAAGDCPSGIGSRSVWATPTTIDSGASCPAGSKSVTFGIDNSWAGSGLPLTRYVNGSTGFAIVQWTTRALADQGQGGFRNLGIAPAHPPGQWSPVVSNSGTTSTNATQETMTVTYSVGGTPATNALKGSTITIAKGTSRACFRTVSANDATTITWTGGNCDLDASDTWEVTWHACLSSGYGGTARDNPFTAAEDESACDSESIAAYYPAILRGGGISDSYIGCAALSKSCLDTYAQGTTYQRNWIDLYRGTATDPAGTGSNIFDNVFDGSRSRAVLSTVLTGFGQSISFQRNLVQNLKGMVWNSAFNNEGFDFGFNTIRNTYAAGSFIINISSGQALHIHNNVFQGNFDGIYVNPSVANVHNLLIENNTWEHAAGSYGLIALDDGAYAMTNVTIRNEHVNTADSTARCFITADPGIGADLQSHSYEGNSIVGRNGGHRVVCYDAAVSLAVSDSDAPDTFVYLPHTSRNVYEVSGTETLEIGFDRIIRTAAAWGDCQNLPDGLYYIADDDGTCGDAGADGVLDGGDSVSFASPCMCDNAGDSGDGAWTAF